MLERLKGKFWSSIRDMIWQKAQELYQADQARSMEEAFKGITAEACGITVQGKNKWITLIQNASHNP